MTNPTTALCVIAKDKSDIIERMLDSTAGVFDFYILQDTGSTDQTVELWEQWCKKTGRPYEISKKELGKDYDFVFVNGRKVLAEFDKARQDSFDMAKKLGASAAFWLDTDDIIINPNIIPSITAKMCAADLSAVLITYDYAEAINGLRAVTQVRERLINLKHSGRWTDPVHETYNFESDAKIVTLAQLTGEQDVLKVVHKRSPFDSSDGGHAKPENRRNNLIMTRAIERIGLQNVSDKLIRNLGFDHFEYGEWELAIQWYEYLINVKKLDNKPAELLYDIYQKLAKAYLATEANDKAMGAAYQLKRILPQLSDGDLLLAELFIYAGDWESAIRHSDRVIARGIPKNIAVTNEMDYTIVPRRIKLQALVALNKVDEAIQVAKELLSIMPSNTQLRSELTKLEQDKRRIAVIEGIKALTVYMQYASQFNQLESIISSIPIDLRDDPVVRRFIKEIKYDVKRKSNKTVLSGIKSIVFYAGGHFEPWDGHSDINKGIGGSEGMCIQMARGLAALGNKVVVFNYCGDSDGKTFDDVLYLDHRKWNPDTKCDIFISLRIPSLFGSYQGDTPIINAIKQYLWLHDTGYGDLPLIAFTAPNKVIALSDAHIESLKQAHGITNDSIFFKTRNALNKHAIEYADKNAGARDPYKVIYASSYDRGLLDALKMWPKIVEKVPEAHLDIYYGLNTFDAIMENNLSHPQSKQRGEEMKAFRAELMELIAKTPNVRELGRISQDELYKEFAQSAIWFYPTEFYEISCITAMQAHALGAVPVCTPFAALKETVNSRYSYKTNKLQIVSAVVHALTHQDELEKKRSLGIEWARKEYNIDTLAQQWDAFFNND